MTNNSPPNSFFSMVTGKNEETRRSDEDRSIDSDETNNLVADSFDAYSGEDEHRFRTNVNT